GTRGAVTRGDVPSQAVQECAGGEVDAWGPSGANMGRREDADTSRIMTLGVSGGGLAVVALRGVWDHLTAMGTHVRDPGEIGAPKHRSQASIRGSNRYRGERAGPHTCATCGKPMLPLAV